VSSSRKSSSIRRAAPQSEAARLLVEYDQSPHRFARTVARQRICSLLVSGDIPFDAPLSERAIADAIGIGRMPVREALRDLAREHVVTVEPGRGTFLRRLDPSQVTELLEVRLALECTGARLAAEKGYVGDFPEIVTSLKGLRKGAFVGKRIGLAETVGDRVHGSLIDGSGNETLSSIYAGLKLRIGISLRLVQRRDVKRIRETVDEHLAIAEAILNGSADAAVDALQFHLRRGHAITMSRLTNASIPQSEARRSVSAMARPRGRPKR
jgi:DNA-binding GntR family transcriptional regulator